MARSDWIYRYHGCGKLDYCLPVVPLVLGVLVLYYVGHCVYNLYFHPLAKFPGSKLAAVNLWYEFYNDVVKAGHYLWEIARMHDKYGEYVVRSLSRP